MTSNVHRDRTCPVRGHGTFDGHTHDLVVTEVILNVFQYRLAPPISYRNEFSVAVAIFEDANNAAFGKRYLNRGRVPEGQGQNVVSTPVLIQ